MAREIKAALTYAQNQELEQTHSQAAERDVDQVMSFIENFIVTYTDYFEEGKINLFAVEAHPNIRQKEAQVAFILINLTGETISEMTAKIQLEVEDFGVTFDAMDWTIPAEFLGDWEDGYAILVVDNVPMNGAPTKMSYGIGDIVMDVGEIMVRHPK
ncbi:MAG: hypothetical protein Q4A67_05425 [Aerococcus sp.]|nr:hypothetical protein [Aerococcus sp.]